MFVVFAWVSVIAFSTCVTHSDASIHTPSTTTIRQVPAPSRMVRASR
jgi:hypothetical protein